MPRINPTDEVQTKFTQQDVDLAVLLESIKSSIKRLDEKADHQYLDLKKDIGLVDEKVKATDAKMAIMSTVLDEKANTADVPNKTEFELLKKTFLIVGSTTLTVTVGAILTFIISGGLTK